MFVDSHAHLDSPDFQDDLKAVLRRAEAADVSSILTIGCVQNEIQGLAAFIALLAAHEFLYGAVGVHPHDARFYDDRLVEGIAELMQHPKILGWGEIGLDFHYDNSPRPEQIEAFRGQLRRARAAQKPVIIHSRDADEMTCRILEEEFSDGPGGVLHCFASGLSMAERCLRLGFCVSFGGILTFHKAGELRETARLIPRDKVLIETDSPYLAPVPFRGKRNEPAFVVKVAETLGELWGVSPEEVGSRTGTNFEQLFSPR